MMRSRTTVCRVPPRLWWTIYSTVPALAKLPRAKPANPPRPRKPPKPPAYPKPRAAADSTNPALCTTCRSCTEKQATRTRIPPEPTNPPPGRRPRPPSGIRGRAKARDTTAVPRAPCPPRSLGRVNVSGYRWVCGATRSLKRIAKSVNVWVYRWGRDATKSLRNSANTPLLMVVCRKIWNTGKRIARRFWGKRRRTRKIVKRTEERISRIARRAGKRINKIGRRIATPKLLRVWKARAFLIHTGTSRSTCTRWNTPIRTGRLSPQLGAPTATPTRFSLYSIPTSTMLTPMLTPPSHPKRWRIATAPSASTAPKKSPAPPNATARSATIAPKKDPAMSPIAIDESGTVRNAGSRRMDAADPDGVSGKTRATITTTFGSPVPPPPIPPTGWPGMRYKRQPRVLRRMRIRTI
mmetsp:Transcript_1048/g.1240  ORF Transcript_1048/g.1240 Transcript_1048/m.1240 type:complete len:409 (+) Transcript_1048:699-1925(+)